LRPGTERQRHEGKLSERPVMESAKICWVVDLGTIPYGRACDLQRQVLAARKGGGIPDVLLLCEHPHVITLGRNGRREHLRAEEHRLAEMNVEFHETDRGGDITYHGPGQIVGYPILDLAEGRRDVRWYVSQLEEVMIRASLDFKIPAKRVEGRHGVWVSTPAGEEKLAALGVHLSRWVTSHGFAYNVSTELRYFDLIVPCGIADTRSTSVERVLGRAVSNEEVRPHLVKQLGEVLERALAPVSRRELEQILADQASAGQPFDGHRAAEVTPA
jgi:lipoyl(octanoyl) transferase